MNLQKLQHFILFLRNNFFLLSILLFAFFLRIIFLDRFPIGITHDELNYIIAAKSLYLTGNFAPGTAPALFPINMSNYSVVIAEIPAFLLVPLIGPLDFSLFASRIMGGFFSTSIVLAVYFIAKHLTRNRLFALISASAMAINPWSFLMGRTIFEVNFFVAFFLWGFITLMRFRGLKIFYALPLYILGFLSYTGGQLSFYLFIIVTLIYHYIYFKPNKKSLKPYFAFFILITLALAIYLAAVFNNQSFSSRGTELYTPLNPSVNKSVNHERITAIPSEINNLFINKLTVYSKGFLEKYLSTFSVNNLFLNGEPRAAFSYQQHGTFYFIDFLFILIGLSFLFKANLKGWVFVVAVIAAGIITSGLNIVEYSYSQRAALMFPFFVILTGIGAGFVITSLHSNARRIVASVITAIYILLFINLMHIYFYRFPVYASDGWFYQERVLSKYIELTGKQYPGRKISITAKEPKILFEEYLFFNNLYRGKEASVINGKMSRKDYSINEVIFSEDCPGDLNNTTFIYDSKTDCPMEKGGILRITRFRDVYENFLIKKDVLCQNYPLSPYVFPSAFNDLVPEKQDPKKFCQSWITEL